MASIIGQNHWWQNWPKTHAYIAEEMFFPRTSDDIAWAIQRAEALAKPIRAVGGGWSFSDASLPGSVTTNRPGVQGVEAIAKVVPRTVTFPPPSPIPSPSIASIPAGMRGSDAAGTMTMIADPNTLETAIGLWVYSGGGLWTYGVTWLYPANDPATLEYFGSKGVRPIRTLLPGQVLKDADVAGSLVMFDMSLPTPAPSADWLYKGDGVWSVGVAGNSPFDQGDLATLFNHGRLGAVSPRAAGTGEALSLVLSRSGNVPKLPEPVFLVDTRLVAASLQDRLPQILSATALDASARNKPAYARKFYAHVEAGITIQQLGELLAHQSPPQSLLAISGSPGASLAGALATGTHGAEFKWPLLIDTVKAVHLVGPGGVHWWIEGTDSIADPVKLREAYPEISPDHIIAGTAPVAGITPQDWLNAAIVSMGSMGVVYSMVLEVVPQFGVHEVIVQTTWNAMGTDLAAVPMPNPALQPLDFATKLRLGPTAMAASTAMLHYLLDGTMNKTGITPDNNVYCDLAINPNRRADGDFDAWIGNREKMDRLPIDPQPAATGNELGGMFEGVGRAFGSDPSALQRLLNVNKLGNPWDLAFHSGPTFSAFGRLGSSADLIDVGLDTVLTPMIGSQDGNVISQELLTGILSGLLGTANDAMRSDKIGVSVGALGFPASGVMGTALEIALAPSAAFAFLQTEILDRIDAARPFFGYVSIRICKSTKTLMGMQQFEDPMDPYSVMIEVVAFGTPNGIQFLRDLQDRAIARLNGGLDLMLHWGLENDRISGDHLRKTVALRRPSDHPLMSRLDTWKAVRGVVRAASDAPFTAFDNAFTARMWLNETVADDDPASFQTVQLGARRQTKVGPFNHGNAPMRIVGVMADGDFRMHASYESPSRPANLEVGPIPTAPVAVGDIFELPLTFIPSDIGTHTGTLTIVTYADVPNSIRVIRIGLHALVDAFAVSLVDPAPPAPLDFGPVDVGSTRTVGVVVHADGTLGASLDHFVASDPAGAAQVDIAINFVGGVAAGQDKTYWVSYTPNVAGPLSTTLTLTFTGGGPFTPYSQDVVLPVVGSGVGAQAELSPAALDFGTLTVNAHTAPQLVTVRNVGQAPLLITGSITGSGFLLAGPLPVSILPGQEDQVAVEFRPVGDGPVSDTFTIQSNSAQPPVPVVLTGVGVLEALLTATPASLGFGTVPVGSKSPAKQVVVSNAGVRPVVLASFSFSGPDAADFTITANDRQPGDALLPEQTCTITVVFGGSGAGPRATTLEIAHDWPNSPFRLPVNGLAVDPKGVVPLVTEVEFGDVPVGTKSAARRVTLVNKSGSVANIKTVEITGMDLADFVLGKDGCSGAQLQDGDKCMVQVVAVPAAIGRKEAELTVTADVPAEVVPLRANGLDISVQWSTALVDFATWKVGQTSNPRETVSIHNSGNTSVVIAQIDVAGDFFVQDPAAAFPEIRPNTDRFLWVWFRPTTPGTLNGSITIQTVDHGPLPPLALTGVAIA
jgi:HYDIN/CFA65/VesB family protein